MIELIVAIAVLAAISAPALLFYQNSVKTSVSGVVNLEMLAEGKRIIAELNDDLRNSCIPHQSAFSFSFNDLVVSTPSGISDRTAAEYALYRYAREPKIVRQRNLKSSMILRPLLSVRYNLEKNSNNDLFRLVRTEALIGGANRVKVLSERICKLQVQPVRLICKDGGSTWLWNTFLQIGHAADGNYDSNALRGRGNGTIVMEFHDLINSEFYSAINKQPQALRNWNTGMTYDPN